MWMDYNFAWLTGLGDDDAHAMAMNVTATLESWAQSTFSGIAATNYQGSMQVTALNDAGYTPIFMNDAMYDQLPAQSYEDGNYQRLKTIQKAVDPTGFFPGRTGGFKYT